MTGEWSTAISHQILFVDDETSVLDGLRRMLRPMRNDWQMTFATGGREALGLIEAQTVDVLVSDMRMPGMDGAELLDGAQQLRPEMMRMALSGQSDLSMNLRCVRTTHQYLTKPCDPQLLKTAISRACALQDQLNSASLKQLVTGLGRLPSEPLAYERLVAELSRPDPNIAELGRIFASDMAIAAKALQLVNSGFFQPGEIVTSPAAAARLLGSERIRSLVELDAFHAADAAAAAELRWLWTHTDATQRNARAIAAHEGLSTTAIEEAASAALLHDIGRLLLATTFAQQYADVITEAAQRQTPFAQLEEHAFGATHSAVGASLLGSWGLPDALVDAVGEHQTTQTVADQALSTQELVRVADAFASNAGDAIGCIDRVGELIPAAARERVAAWGVACDRAAEAR